MASSQPHFDRLQQAKRVLREGGAVEEAIKIARDVAYEAAYRLLSSKTKVEGRPSLTEMGYRLFEENLVDEETSMMLRELAMMLEMAHYDILAIYTKEQLMEKLQKVELLTSLL